MSATVGHPVTPTKAVLDRKGHKRRRQEWARIVRKAIPEALLEQKEQRATLYPQPETSVVYTQP